MDKNTCPFCEIEDKSRIIYENDGWIGLMDGFPVTEGHTLLIPKRHVPTIMELNHHEKLSLLQAIDDVIVILKDRYNPQGFNVGTNCGRASGQTVMHCHIHIIPRYNGDCQDPRGGVRGVIPSKQKY